MDIAREVKSSEKLPIILQLVLALGKYAEGEDGEEIAAFKLDALAQLKEIPFPKNVGITFCDAVVTVRRGLTTKLNVPAHNHL